MKIGKELERKNQVIVVTTEQELEKVIDTLQGETAFTLVEDVDSADIPSLVQIHQKFSQSERLVILSKNYEIVDNPYYPVVIIKNSIPAVEIQSEITTQPQVEQPMTESQYTEKTDEAISEQTVSTQTAEELSAEEQPIEQPIEHATVEQIVDPSANQLPASSNSIPQLPPLGPVQYKPEELAAMGVGISVKYPGYMYFLDSKAITSVDATTNTFIFHEGFFEI